MLLPFLFYWKLFALDPDERQIFRGDFLNQHYVWKSYSLERIRHGELPLWNPHVLGGVAMHANPQVGVFYLPNYLLILAHQDARVSYVALEAFQLLHLALAGVGMWLFLRFLGLRSLGAFTGALVSMFTGFFTTPGHHALVLTASWVPLNLYLTGRVFDSNGLRTVAGLAVGLSLMILAGHPQPAYYGSLLITAWALYQGGWRRVVRRYVPALVLAVGLSAVQLLPTYQLARDSSRQDAGYGFAATFGFSPYLLPGALVPREQIRLPGQDPSTPLHIYVGVGGLLLAAVGLAGSRRRVRWFFVAVAAASLLLSFGSLSFLFDLAYAALPGFGRFRVPYRILGLYAIAMSVLAGLGMDALLSASRRIRTRMKYVLHGTFGLLLLLAVWSAYTHTRLLVSPGALSPRQVERLVSGVNWALVLVLLNLVGLLALGWRGGKRWPARAIVLLLVVDLGSFVKDRGQHPYRTLIRSAERPMHVLARAQGHRNRYVTDTNLESYAMLHGAEFAGGQDSLTDARYAELLGESMKSANVLSLLNVKFVARPGLPSRIRWCGPRFPSPLPLIDIPPSLSPLKLTLLSATEASNLRIYWSGVAPGREDARVRLNSGEPARLAVNPWEVSFAVRETVREITFEVQESSPGIRIEQIEIDGSPLGLLTDFIDLGGIKLNLHCLPRAYFAAEADAPPYPPTAESLECWTPFDPVGVRDDETGEIGGGYLRSQGVRIVRYEPEEVEIEVDSPRAGFVVLADTYRPGWTAEVDGGKRRVLRAQHALRAVRVEAGRHRIVFSYRPWSLYFGALISIVSMLLLFLLLVRPFWRSERHGLPSDVPSMGGS